MAEPMPVTGRVCAISSTGILAGPCGTRERRGVSRAATPTTLATMAPGRVEALVRGRGRAPLEAERADHHCGQPGPGQRGEQQPSLAEACGQAADGAADGRAV
jgi:hypothetical protein